MEIKFYGQACFLIEDKSIKVLTDPFGEKVGKVPSWQAEVVTLSHADEAHSNEQAVNGSPMILKWPGEYETKGVHFKAIPSFFENDGQEIENNIFVIHFSGIKFCHLGGLNKKLTPEQLEQIGDVDVLFVPVGGGAFLNAKKAKEVAEQIEPRIFIPMMYRTEGHKNEFDPLTGFLSEMGSNNVEAVDSFKFKKNELPEDSSKLMVLNVLN